MSFGDRLGHFVIFVVLTILTLGIYPLYFMVSTTRENNKLLKEIRDALRSSSPTAKPSSEGREH